MYWVLFVPYHEWLFDGLYPALIEDVTVERTAFFIRLGLYAVFALPLLSFNILFDYAKVRAVVEDRRSMIGALVGELAVHAPASDRGVGALRDQRARVPAGDRRSIT